MVRAREVTLPTTRRGRAAPPWPLPPMLAKPSAAMPAKPDAYVFEFKWDGYRTLLHCDAGKARVQTRRGLDATREYPELQRVAASLGERQALLDGEIVVLDAHGRPDFQALQNALGRGPGPKPTRKVEVTFLAFDLLWLDGASLLDAPWEERRAALEGLGKGGEGWWIPPVNDDGDALLAASKELGLEGIVAKQRASSYQAGQRTGAWLKVKNIRRQEFVVGGWTPGEAGLRGSLGALLVGYYDRDKLRHAGRVGTGFTDAARRQLLEGFAEIERPDNPFEPDPEIPSQAHFVDPVLVCEVAFASWTRDGHLRHPSFQGLRNDKDPREVVREEVP
ncbi:MAG TPA: non-homologous end-joining DNA ligase [Candidatus Thermoplasmatota archaeon]|jgi:bifunctional non-homologous end joining protein LigD|nr:non-homologous end-joining DNA ligase [Candidatus Thermoplasmatota archaeon]